MRTGFEQVHVENDWYDGPRSGLANVNGVPHYFQAVHDYNRPDAPHDQYFVWPADELTFSLEREQWGIFVAWNDAYEAGAATVDSHPAVGEIDARYDELQKLLAPRRTVPDEARLLVAEWRGIPGAVGRYHVAGLCYLDGLIPRGVVGVAAGV